MRRRTQTLLLLLALLTGGAIALAGAIPEGFETVSNVAGNPDRFYGREVHLKAIVVEGSVVPDPEASRFVVTDTTRELPVVYPGALPEVALDGRTIVVSGTLALRDGAPVFVASDLQGGCASRYEPTVG